MTLGKSRPSPGYRLPARRSPDPLAASLRPPHEASRPRRPRRPLTGGTPGTAGRASPRGARPKVMRPAGRWASYPGVHCPHGSLAGRRLAELNRPDHGPSGEGKGRVRGGGAVSQCNTHKPRTQRTGGSHDTPPPGSRCFSSLVLKSP